MTNDMTNTLLDERDIRGLRNAYGRALDTRDWALFEGLFTDEVLADFSAWGIPARVMTPKELSTTMKPAFSRVEMRSQQVYSNFVIEVSGDEARATSSLVGYHHLPGCEGGDRFTLHATYHDRLRRTAAGWKLCSVKLEVVFADGNPAVLQ